MSVAATVGARGSSAATVDSSGLFEPIQSALRPVTGAGDALDAGGRVGDMALRVWSHAVRAYNRTIDDLNAEWLQAKATDFGVDALVVNRASMTPADVEGAVSDHATAISDARSSLMARLNARQREAEGRLDRVADHAGLLLERSDDPDAQALAWFAAIGGLAMTSGTAVADISDDGTTYPDSVMHGDPDAYWSTPAARAAQMREDELDNYDGADIGWNDAVEALAFIFADPRECVGDDASVGGCGLEAASLLPVAKLLKGIKVYRRVKHADDAAEDAHDARRATDRNLDDVESLRGASQSDVRSLIPDHWSERPMRKGEGVRYLNPDRPGEAIIVEEGWPGATDPLHSGPYVKISKDGKVQRIPLEGNPVLE